MKFLQVGLGSMGKRRIRCLKALGENNIVGFDIREDRRKEVEKEYGVKAFSDFEKALEFMPDAGIISTPPDLHTKYALELAKKGISFFTEASVLNDDLKELSEVVKKNKILGAPSCTLRFHPLIKKLKSLVDEKAIGNILSFTYHSGQYLPDWHPWEDYRNFYVSKKETGACREIVPFELVWLVWIFGDILEVSCFKAKLTKLETEIDDLYQILIKFNSGIIGHLMVDVISRKAYRICRFISEDGVIEMDWTKKSLIIFNANQNTSQEYIMPEGKIMKGYIVSEDMYIEEMEKFIKALKGIEDFGYTIDEDNKVLEILYKIEKSNFEGKHIRIGGNK